MSSKVYIEYSFEHGDWCIIHPDNALGMIQTGFASKEEALWEVEHRSDVILIEHPDGPKGGDSE